MDTTRSNKWCIVLNSSPDHNLDDITLLVCKKLNEQYGYKYANIIHDMDKDDAGNMKTHHSHIVIWKGVRTRKTTLLKFISDIIEQNENTISIDPCVVVKSSIRYLCHLDSPEKHQYLKGDIDTDDFTEVQNYLDNVDNDVSGQTLYEIIKECGCDKAAVAIQLGPTKYCRWKSFIELFCK